MKSSTLFIRAICKGINMSYEQKEKWVQRFMALVFLIAMIVFLWTSMGKGDKEIAEEGAKTENIQTNAPTSMPNAE